MTGGPAEPKTAAGARAAAAHFYSLYFAGSFVASWDLLTPVAKRQISQSVWVKVHSACPSAVNGKARVIKSVILFGDTAIITERQAGVRPRRSKAEDVFKYTNGHWGYVPGIPGVYHRGSVAADIAAAKASGLCATRKAAPL